jgi:hypothetical protein
MFILQRWAYAVSVRTSALLLIYKLIAKVRTKKSCGYAVADLQLSEGEFYFRVIVPESNAEEWICYCERHFLRKLWSERICD